MSSLQRPHDWGRRYSWPWRLAAGGWRLAADGSESTNAWGDFLDELVGRGLRPPLLVISDGAAGLINAVETALPRSLRQRCLIHRCRNVLARVLAEAQRELRDAYWATFDTEDLIAAGLQPGPGLVTAVQRRIDAFAETYGRAYPAAVKCLLTERDQLTSYLRFPVEHRWPRPAPGCSTTYATNDSTHRRRYDPPTPPRSPRGLRLLS